MSLRDEIVGCARRFEADIVCFGSIDHFAGMGVENILPDTRTVICLAFRVLRGVYRGIEEGSTYYQYSTNGVEVLEEVVMPRALYRVCALLEDAGYQALPQRRQQLVMPQEHGHNFEMHYEDIYHGRHTELSLDFERCAALCGLGQVGLSGSLLTAQYGPMQRYCFVLTDAALDASPLAAPLCDRCGACQQACPGAAISPQGGREPWQCGPYYRGACRATNPFMPPDALMDFADRAAIMAGDVRLHEQESIRLMENCIFYPPIKQGYASSICGRACDMACYDHLEQKGVITKHYAGPFRRRPAWRLSEEE